MNWKWASGLGFIFFFIVLIGLFELDFRNRQAQDPKDGVIEITWNLLAQLDYRGGRIPRPIKRINGQMVRIAGYIVPLVDDFTEIKEFLLVPNGQACVHVPPPPPNLIIHVKLNHPIPAHKIRNPVWLTGILSVETSESVHGPSSYKVIAKEIKGY